MSLIRDPGQDCVKFVRKDAESGFQISVTFQLTTISSSLLHSFYECQETTIAQAFQTVLDLAAIVPLNLTFKT